MISDRTLNIGNYFLDIAELHLVLYTGHESTPRSRDGGRLIAWTGTPRAQGFQNSWNIAISTMKIAPIFWCYTKLQIVLFQGIKDLPDYVSFNKFPAIPLHDIFSAAGDDLLDLLYKLFRFCPPERITATKVRINQPCTRLEDQHITVDTFFAFSWWSPEYASVRVVMPLLYSKKKFRNEVFFGVTKSISTDTNINWVLLKDHNCSTEKCINHEYKINYRILSRMYYSVLFSMSFSCATLPLVVISRMYYSHINSHVWIFDKMAPSSSSNWYCCSNVWHMLCHLLRSLNPFHEQNSIVEFKLVISVTLYTVPWFHAMQFSFLPY